MAIIEGAVRAVEEAALTQKIDELCAEKSKLPPVDPRRRTSPMPASKDMPRMLGKFSVTTGLVRDNGVCVGDESLQSAGIDSATLTHFIIDAGEFNNVGRNGGRR